MSVSSCENARYTIRPTRNFTRSRTRASSVRGRVRAKARTSSRVTMRPTIRRARDTAGAFIAKHLGFPCAADDRGLRADRRPPDLGAAGPHGVDRLVLLPALR